MTHRNEAAGFLRAVVARPDDDLPRLIYADWLDERGEAVRAEFIRLQCLLARSPQHPCAPPPPVGGGAVCPAAGCQAVQSRRRAQELLNQLSSELPIRHAAWAEPPPPHVAGIEPAAVYRRGFIESMTLTAAEWLRHAEAIVAAHPVREVTLTTWPDRPPPAGRPAGGHALRRITVRGRASEGRLPGASVADQLREWFPGVAVEVGGPVPNRLRLPDRLPGRRGDPVCEAEGGRPIGVVAGIDDASGTLVFHTT
jgi:uncharacterized protein (TIGR02996 family)